MVNYCCSMVDYCLQQPVAAVEIGAREFNNSLKVAIISLLF